MGTDLSQSAVNEVKQHVLQCPQCYEFYEQLISSQEALAVLSEDIELKPQASLWPDIQSRLQETQLSTQRPYWQRSLGFVGRVAVAASVLLVATQIRWQPTRPVIPSIDSRVNAASLGEPVYLEPSWRALEKLEPAEEGHEFLRNVSY